MDRRSLQKSIAEKLNAKFDKNESKTLARYLIEDLLDLDQKIDEATFESIEVAVRRILDEEPIQYVTHRADFYGYQFYVDNAVLIPRPETEELVYNVIQYLKKKGNESYKIIDIGTGSGCIPIAIKKEFEKCNVSAIDISRSALKVAIQNANALCAEVTFAHHDILSNKNFREQVVYDVIVSNPPYIPESERRKMSASTLLHEPNLALFTTDEFGLTFYKRIAHICKDWLADDGAVFLELNEFQSDKIKQIFDEQGLFRSVSIVTDLQGKNRILVALR